MGSSLSTDAKWRAVAEFHGLQLGNDAAECSYGLLPVDARSDKTQIRRMLFKQIAAHRSGTKQIIAQEPQLAYDVSWQVTNTLWYGSLLQASPAVVGGMIRLTTGSGTQVKLLDTGVKTCYSALGLLRVFVAQRDQLSLALHTMQCEPLVQHNPAHAAIAGLKVAAREKASQHYAHYAHNPFAAQSVSLVAEQSDMFGQKLSGKRFECAVDGHNPIKENWTWFDCGLPYNCSERCVPTIAKPSTHQNGLSA